MKKQTKKDPFHGMTKKQLTALVQRQPAYGLWWTRGIGGGFWSLWAGFCAGRRGIEYPSNV